MVEPRLKKPLDMSMIQPDAIKASIDDLWGRALDLKKECIAIQQKITGTPSLPEYLSAYSEISGYEGTIKKYVAEFEKNARELGKCGVYSKERAEAEIRAFRETTERVWQLRLPGNYVEQLYESPKLAGRLAKIELGLARFPAMPKLATPVKGKLTEAQKKANEVAQKKFDQEMGKFSENAAKIRALARDYGIFAGELIGLAEKIERMAANPKDYAEQSKKTEALKELHEKIRAIQGIAKFTFVEASHYKSQEEINDEYFALGLPKTEVVSIEDYSGRILMAEVFVIKEDMGELSSGKKTGMDFVAEKQAEVIGEWRRRGRPLQEAPQVQKDEKELDGIRRALFARKTALLAEYGKRVKEIDEIAKSDMLKCEVLRGKGGKYTDEDKEWIIKESEYLNGLRLEGVPQITILEEKPKETRANLHDALSKISVDPTLPRRTYAGRSFIKIEDYWVERQNNWVKIQREALRTLSTAQARPFDEEDLQAIGAIGK